MKIFLFIFFSAILLNGNGQQIESFQFDSDKVESYELDFIEINNLVLIPVTINKTESLYFILDSGAEHTVLFGSETNNLSIDTTYLRKVRVAGAGKNEAISAYVSPHNSLKIGTVKGGNLNLIYIPDKFVQFSDLLGHPVHGILGVSIFHSFVIELDYFSHKVRFHNPETYHVPKRFNKLDITIEGNRPFIDLDIEITPRVNLKTNLLVDLGESKPISLFLNSHEYIYLPYPNYAANLGKGINGIIEGRVAKLESVIIDKYQLNNVIASFPDVKALKFLTTNANRNGSLGAGILKRFRTVFDLRDKAIYLKKTGLLRQPFNYDKTGLIVVAEGSDFGTFRISGIVDDSPGQKAGLQAGDIITYISGDSVEGLKFGEMLQLIENSGRKIEIIVLRNDKEVKKTMRVFRLI